MPSSFSRIAIGVIAVLGEAKVPVTASGGVKGEYEQKIQGLLVKLDDWNNSLMMKFRATYIVYQGDPCASYGFLQREVIEIMRKHQLIQRINLQIEGLVALIKGAGKAAPAEDTRREFIALYRRILDQVGDPAAPEAAVVEIAAAAREAQQWRGDASAR